MHMTSDKTEKKELTKINWKLKLQAAMCRGMLRGFNVISCVQHVALWLHLYIGLCVQDRTVIKHVKFGPDRNEEVVPVWSGGLLLLVLNNVHWSQKNCLQST